MSTLDTDTIRERLADLDGWELDDDHITRGWTFADFRSAIGFINRVADLADQADHHPDLHNSYTSVRISLTTHSEGGVTERDLDLAARIDEVVEG
jgi:4a-hydroxytetrahydrobiopterin dehydratase